MANFAERLAAVNRRFVVERSPWLVAVSHTSLAVVLSAIVTLAMASVVFPAQLAEAMAFAVVVPLIVAGPLSYMNARTWRALEKAEATLRESEARLTAMTANIPGVVYQRALADDGSVTFPYVSEQALEVLGFESREIAADPAILSKDMSSEEWENFRAGLDESARTMEPIDADWRLVTKSGETRWFRNRSRPRRLENGALIWDGMVIDDTQRMRAEQALRVSESRARLMADGLPAFVTYVGSDLTFQFVNKSYAAFLGRTVEEAQGMNVAEAIGIDAYKEVLPSMQRALAGQTATYEGTALDAEGESRSVEGIFVPHTEADGRVVGFFALVQDVTEPRRMALALRESEQRYADLYRKTPAMLHSNDADGIILSVSDYWLDVMGYSRPEVLGRPFTDFMTEESVRAALDVPLPRFRRGGSLSDIPRQFVKKNGEVIDVLVSAFAERDADGQFLRSITYLRDITAQKRAEVALRETQRRHVDAYNNSPVMLHTTDRESRFRAVSNYWLGVMGYTREQVIGRRVTDFMTESAADAARALRPTLLKTGFVKNAPRVYVKANGEEIDVLISAVAEWDAGGEFAGTMTVAVDVTQQKRAEGALRESEARTRTILETAADAVITVDENGIIIAANRASEDMFGYSQSRLIGASIGMLAPEALRRQLATYLSRLTPQSDEAHGGLYEAEGLRSDKSTFPFEFTATATSIQGRRLVTAFVRDISERKEMERMKTEFISTVSHELRTPLTSITAALGLVADGLAGQIPAEAFELIAIAHRNSERLVRLTDDILDVERMESGRLRYDLQIHDLRSLVDQALEANRAFADHCHVLFTLADEAPGVRLKVDGDRLLQVITNLLSNASKFSPPGATVAVTIGQDGATVRVAVADQGPGISRALAPRIFQKFAQGDSSDSRHRGGAGLGLSICQAIINDLGGRIGYESEPGHGATFFFELDEWVGEPEAPASP